MPADMREKIFEATDFGQTALKKIGQVLDSFRLYKAEWVEDKPEDFDTMIVTGAEFRIAKSGKNKGKMTVLLPGTKRTVSVTRAEIQAFDTQVRSE